MVYRCSIRISNIFSYNLINFIEGRNNGYLSEDDKGQGKRVWRIYLWSDSKYSKSNENSNVALLGVKLAMCPIC